MIAYTYKIVFQHRVSRPDRKRLRECAKKLGYRCLSVFCFLFLFLFVFNLFVKLGDEYALSLDTQKLMNRKIILCVFFTCRVTQQFTKPKSAQLFHDYSCRIWLNFIFFFALNFIQLVDFAVVIPSLILLQRNIDWWWLSWLKLIVLFSQSVQII